MGLVGPASSDAVGPLIRLLGDSRWSDKRIVLQALGGIGRGAQTALPHLFALLMDKDRRIRQEAAKAISMIEPRADVIATNWIAGAGEANHACKINRFPKEGPIWEIAFDGKTIRLADSRGLQYINHLISHPNEEVHVIELAAIARKPTAIRAVGKGEIQPDEPSDGPRTSGGYGASAIDHGEPMLDPQAISEIKEARKDLLKRIAKAEKNHDEAMAEKLQNELHSLNMHATKMFYGGKVKNLGNHAHKIRKSVSKCIRAILDKIEQEHPTLSNHFTGSISTGMCCSYKPQPSIVWSTDLPA